MGLSQEQWFEKIKSYVPSWVFQDEVYNKAMFEGVAKMLAQGQVQYENHLKETFIDTASEEFLDIQAAERGVERSVNDSLPSYRLKIKNIVSKTNCPAIKDVVDGFLINGTSKIVEHKEVENFYNQGSFFNRNVIDVSITYNAFTIIVDYQVPPESWYMGREAFYNREYLYGANVSLDSVFNNIIEVVNKNKGYGTVYRLIERSKEV